MKKFSTILLLSLAILCSFGLFAMYIWDSIVIKQNMKTAIAAGTFLSNKITTITVGLQHITATEAAYWQQDEISIDSKMYDVVSVRKEHGKLVIKCICDESENLLIATYRKAVEKTQGNSTDKNGISHKSIFSPFTVSNVGIAFLPIKKESALILIEYQIPIAKVHYSGVLTPPPRQV